MVGGPADRCGCVGPSGLLGQRLHHRVGHHATERRRLGGWDRRICAYIVSMFVSMGVGRLLDATNGNYRILFGIASSLYLIGLVIMHFILPKTGSGKTPAGIEV